MRVSRSTLQAVAVDTPVVSSVGASSFRSARDDIGLGHGADGLQQLQKAHAAGLRGAGAGEAGGVQTVQVDGQVHGHFALAELGRQFGQAGKIELVQLGVLGGKLELGPVAAADAELVDMAVALPARGSGAAHRRG